MSVASRKILTLVMHIFMYKCITLGERTSSLVEGYTGHEEQVNNNDNNVGMIHCHTRATSTKGGGCGIEFLERRVGFSRSCGLMIHE